MGIYGERVGGFARQPVAAQRSRRLFSRRRSPVVSSVASETSRFPRSSARRKTAAPALEHFCHCAETRSSGPSSDLLPTLERPSVSRDLLAVSPHARSPLGHPLGVLPAPLGLELVVVFSEPSLVPGGAAASRRNADLAVPPRPAPASIGDRFAAGCAVRAHQPTRGPVGFQIGVPGFFSRFPRQILVRGSPHQQSRRSAAPLYWNCNYGRPPPHRQPSAPFHLR
jgi:hypothetical protein